MENVALAVSADEIETHLATHNRFFQKTNLTVDDLDVYSTPLADAVNAVHSASLGHITREQALEAIDNAILDFQKIDAALDLANAA